MNSKFHTETYGKWILAGEHAVLRGSPALAFPLRSSTFKFHFEPSDQELSVQFIGEKGQDYRLLFFGVFEHALMQVNRQRDQIRGQLTIDSSLPVGSGLGASAALSVAVGRWFSSIGWVPEEKIYDFSRGLEDLFHGESSGVDIAVSLKGRGIRFLRNRGMTELDPQWTPCLKLSHCGSKGLTSDCVNKVKGLFDRSPDLARRMDEQMSEAVELAEMALMNKSFKDLKTAIVLARDCFEKWGLIFGDLKSHIRQLEEAGAVAVKPTGSGGGGYVLSLWETDPPAHLPNLISAF